MMMMMVVVIVMVMMKIILIITKYLFKVQSKPPRVSKSIAVSSSVMVTGIGSLVLMRLQYSLVNRGEAVTLIVVHCIA